MPHVDGESMGTVSEPPPEVVKAAGRKPRHWTMLPSPEQAEQAAPPEGRPSEPPAERSEENDSGSMARRDFLRLLGTGAAFAAAGCARKPVEKILPYVHAPEEITPGNAVYYASTCGECPAGCGVLVKTREGRPIKLEGNRAHPLNRGALCPRGQAAILNLYDPDRLQAPVTIDRARGTATPVAWSEIDARATRALSDARARGGKIVLLTGTLSSPSTEALIGQFLAALPGSEHVVYDAVSADAIAQAQELSYGSRSIPRYRLDRADVLVTIGADPLGSLLSPVEFARDFSTRRRPELGPMSRVIAIEPIVTLTGTNADQRVQVRPDHLLPVALAIANDLLVGRPRGAEGGGAAGYLTPFAAGDVEHRAGLPAGTIAKITDELWESRGKSLVLAGPQAVPAEHAVALQVVMNLLNSALGNEGITVTGGTPARLAAGSEEAMLRLVERMRAGEVAALLLYGVNPVYTLPTAVGFLEGMKRVAFVASLSDRVDETARAADLVAPTTHFLESWNDHEPRMGTLSLAQPAIAPLYDVRPLQETLLAWGRALGSGPLAGSKGTWHEFLRERWRTQVYPSADAAAPFDLFWEGALREGLWMRSRGEEPSPTARSFRGDALRSLPPTGPRTEDGALQLVLYAPPILHDGRSANNAWLQELPDPVSKITWDNYVAIAPARARQLGVWEYEMKADVVTVNVGHATFELPVHIQPGLHPDVIAVALGYGRTAAGRVGNGVGQNAFALAEATAGRVGMSGIPARVTRTGRIAKLAMVQMWNDDENRPIVFEATYPEYLRDPKAGIEEPEHLPSMWSPWEYKGYKWAMAVDLSACIGCEACMIACQVENNVPAVGKPIVLRGREMHWIRIDRYYSGTADDPDFTHQPMLCQHCENAPCETVCPVLATVHSSEGLNLQVYNRCVGTRYCSNNCPYKVRRFNWFDYSHVKAPSLRLALNPDVTVRSKGIMEKCTFCVQRIRDGKERAKALGVRVQDGEIQTACQQTCPTDAIVFGDLNDPKSRVSQLVKNERGYHALAELNTRPRVTYQTKVRNREEATA